MDFNYYVVGQFQEEFRRIEAEKAKVVDGFTSKLLQSANKALNSPRVNEVDDEEEHERYYIITEGRVPKGFATNDYEDAKRLHSTALKTDSNAWICDNQEFQKAKLLRKLDAFGGGLFNNVVEFRTYLRIHVRGHLETERYGYTQATPEHDFGHEMGLVFDSEEYDRCHLRYQKLREREKEIEGLRKAYNEWARKQPTVYREYDRNGRLVREGVFKNGRIYKEA